MKKNLLAIAAVVITLGAYAQTDSSKKMSPPDINNTKSGTNQNANRTIQTAPDSSMNQKTQSNGNADALIMENGKMMMQSKGKLTLMTYDIILNDGTKVLSDGTCFRKEGTKVMLKNGEQIDMTGKIVPVKNPNNMYLIPDTMQK